MCSQLGDGDASHRKKYDINFKSKRSQWNENVAYCSCSTSSSSVMWTTIANGRVNMVSKNDGPNTRTISLIVKIWNSVAKLNTYCVRRTSVFQRFFFFIRCSLELSHFVSRLELYLTHRGNGVGHASPDNVDVRLSPWMIRRKTYLMNKWKMMMNRERWWTPAGYTI